MTNERNLISSDENARRVALNERLEAFGWAALLITVGTIWLLPDRQVPRGSWLMAAGVILLALNAIRYLNGIRMRGFSLVAGTVALFAGLGAYFNWNLPLFPIILIAIGICMLVMPFIDKGSLCSPAVKGCCSMRPSEHEVDQGRTAVGHRGNSA
jgi:hypothetical protein